MSLKAQTKPKTKLVSIDHTCQALTQYLQSMSMIEDNEYVTDLTERAKGIEVFLSSYHKDANV